MNLTEQVYMYIFLFLFYIMYGALNQIWIDTVFIDLNTSALADSV